MGIGIAPESGAPCRADLEHASDHLPVVLKLGIPGMRRESVHTCCRTILYKQIGPELWAGFKAGVSQRMLLPATRASWGLAITTKDTSVLHRLISASVGAGVNMLPRLVQNVTTADLSAGTHLRAVLRSKDNTKTCDELQTEWAERVESLRQQGVSLNKMLDYDASAVLPRETTSGIMAKMKSYIDTRDAMLTAQKDAITRVWSRANTTRHCRRR